MRNLADQVASATTSGGRIVTGGRHIPGPGNYFQPTVIADVPRNADITREEIFGPVALLFRVESLDDAIALANDTPFGLAATAFTSNPHEQQRLAADLHCGGVFFNTMVASDPRLPFGGIRKSGYGRELGAPGMHEFLNAKTIVVNGTQPSAQASLFDETTLAATSASPASATIADAQPAPLPLDPTPFHRPQYAPEAFLESIEQDDIEPAPAITTPPSRFVPRSPAEAATPEPETRDDEPPPRRGSIFNLN